MVKEFNELIGKTIIRIETSNEVYSDELSEINDIVHGNRQIWFYMDDGSKFHMYHDQMCCEDVCVEDVCGDVKCLIGSPITQAEVCNEATMHGETISKYNSTLLTPLKSNCILESLRGSLMYDDDGCPNSFSSKCFFNLFNYFFDKEYGHCVPFPEIKFYLVS